MIKHIYGLCDPRSGCLLYIGQSEHPELRLFEHLGAAGRFDTLKNRWLRELVSEGLAPRLFILETVPGPFANTAEQFYIKLFRALGAQLVNSPTRRGFSFTPEHRAKLSVAARSRRIPQAQRDKIRAAMKGKAKSPEHRAKIIAARRAR